MRRRKASVPTPRAESSHSFSSFSNIPQPIKDIPKVSSTRMFTKFNLSLDVLMIATVFAGFLCFMFGYLVPNAMIFSALIGGIMFIPVGVMIGAMFSGWFRIKILRRITRKNFGIINFIHSNRLIKPVIANLDKDIIHFGDGIYMVNKESIKRQGDESPSSGNIDEGKIKFEEGVPVINYNMDDTMPVDYESKTPKEPGDKYRLPQQISATLNKEIAVEKAKVMNAFKTRQSMFMLIIMGLIAVNIYLTYQVSSTQQAPSTVDTAVVSKAVDDSMRSFYQSYQQQQVATTTIPANIIIPYLK